MPPETDTAARSAAPRTEAAREPIYTTAALDQALNQLRGPLERLRWRKRGRLSLHVSVAGKLNPPPRDGSKARAMLGSGETALLIRDRNGRLAAPTTKWMGRTVAATGHIVIDGRARRWLVPEEIRPFEGEGLPWFDAGALSTKHASFPTKRPLRVAAITSAHRESQVYDDFDRALVREIPGNRKEHYALTARRISIRNPAALAEAIRGTDADVIVTLRGGGRSQEFALLNDPEVLRAFAECGAYRMVGLGHTHDTTMLDLLADFAADTPTDAGFRLGKRILPERETGSMQGPRDDLSSEVRRMGRELRALSESLDRNSRQQETPVAPPIHFRTGVRSWRALCWAAIAGFVAGFAVALWVAKLPARREDPGTAITEPKARRDGAQRSRRRNP